MHRGNTIAAMQGPTNPQDAPGSGLPSSRVAGPTRSPLALAEPPAGQAGERLHSLEAEESLLGAALLTEYVCAGVSERLTVDDFYDPQNRLVFEAIFSLYVDGLPIDCLTVSDFLERNGNLAAAGGPERLLQLEAATPTLTHWERYADIIVERARLRRLAQAGAEITQLARSVPSDADAAIDHAETLIYAVSQQRHANTATVLRTLLDGKLDRLEELYGNPGVPRGLTTGFVGLDKILAGIAPASLVVLGARPSMGKTAFALSIAAHVAQQAPVLLFSLEMDHDEITGRLVAADARVDATKMRTGEFSEDDWSKIGRSFGRLADRQLWVDDTPALTSNDVRARARRIHSRAGGLGLIVVDYLQLLAGRVGAENRQVEVAEMSRSLKILARELRTPVLALSQLSRNLENRSDKRPMLADLRESGSIEQDADVVMFLYRDEVYDPNTPDGGMAEVIVSKHRNGPTGKARLAWMPQWTLFGDLGVD